MGSIKQVEILYRFSHIFAGLFIPWYTPCSLAQWPDASVRMLPRIPKGRLHGVWWVLMYSDAFIKEIPQPYEHAVRIPTWKIDTKFRKYRNRFNNVFWEIFLTEMQCVNSLFFSIHNKSHKCSWFFLVGPSWEITSFTGLNGWIKAWIKGMGGLIAVTLTLFVPNFLFLFSVQMYTLEG